MQDGAALSSLDVQVLRPTLRLNFKVLNAILNCWFFFFLRISLKGTSEHSNVLTAPSNVLQRAEWYTGSCYQYIPFGGSQLLKLGKLGYNWKTRTQLVAGFTVTERDGPMFSSLCSLFCPDPQLTPWVNQSSSEGNRKVTKQGGGRNQTFCYLGEPHQLAVKSDQYCSQCERGTRACVWEQKREGVESGDSEGVGKLPLTVAFQVS